MSKVEFFVEETLLQRARKRRLRALKHLHREGLGLRNIFDTEPKDQDVPQRPKRGEMFQGLSRLA